MTLPLRKSQIKMGNIDEGKLYVDKSDCKSI
jgi:hypothetical protein